MGMFERSWKWASWGAEVTARRPKKQRLGEIDLIEFGRREGRQPQSFSSLGEVISERFSDEMDENKDKAERDSCHRSPVGITDGRKHNHEHQPSVQTHAQPPLPLLAEAVGQGPPNLLLPLEQILFRFESQHEDNHPLVQGTQTGTMPTDLKIITIGSGARNTPNTRPTI